MSATLPSDVEVNDRDLYTTSAEFRAAWKKMRKASDARRALPPGSTRAKVTTANARWSTACEAVERLRQAARACQIQAWYRHTHQVLRLARCGALDRETALGEAQTAREEVRMLRRGAA